MPRGDHPDGSCPDGTRPGAVPAIYAKAGPAPALTPRWLDVMRDASAATDDGQPTLEVTGARRTLRGRTQDEGETLVFVVEVQHRDAQAPGWTRQWPRVSTARGVLLADGTAVLTLGFWDGASQIIAIEADGSPRWDYPLQAMAWLGVLDDGDIAIGLVPEVSRSWRAGHPDAPSVEYRGGAIVGVLDPADGRPRWLAAVGEDAGAWQVRGRSGEDGTVVFTMMLFPGQWDPHCSLPTWPLEIVQGG